MSTRTGPLKGYYHSIDEWLSTQTRHQLNTICPKHYPDKIIVMKNPKGIVDTIHPAFQEINYQTKEAFAAAIPNGRIIGEKGLVITPDHYLLWNLSDDHLQHPLQHEVFQQIKFPPVQSTSETIAVLNYRDSRNYFHWMFDVLPRIHLLQKSPFQINKYVVNELNSPFQFETLASLGISSNQVIQCHKLFHMEAKTLIVTSWIGAISRYPKWASEFIRNELASSFKRKKGKGMERIYISRSKARYRKVLNEDIVMDVLENYGFKKIFPETLSLEDQIDIFSSAEVIVSPHGAGLTNIVFCNPNTKIIELYSPKYVSGYFWLISNHIGLDYYYLLGEDLKDNSHENAGGVDILVNINEFKQLLRLADL